MLTAFGIENFKSYKQATLPLAPLTVLIGANASGKSNAIEALRLLSWIARIARERDLRVLISSHNPALLDALPDDAVPDVVFCYRDPQDGSSRLVRLADIPDYPELIAQGSVGHLMTRGLIDRFVKSDHSPEAKNQRFRDWLAELQADTGAA